MAYNDLPKLLNRAVDARQELFDTEHQGAWRLFNGFYEGCPELVCDVYARTLLLFNYDRDTRSGRERLQQAQRILLERLPWVECVLWKDHRAPQPDQRRGEIRQGDAPARAIREGDTWYAVELLMNQDASFYLDTRLLRRWLLEQAADWQVLNLFAYTGSLGVAALAGEARQVIQVDRSRMFLELARRSLELNGLDSGRMELQAADFFKRAAAFRHQGRLFDCVLLDPPFFSDTRAGQVDMARESIRLINKVRPLVEDGGWLVVINNALFLSGSDYYASLLELCADGYMMIKELIPVPPDVTGYRETRRREPPVDPHPFNHPTKIALLQVRRKD